MMRSADRTHPRASPAPSHAGPRVSVVLPVYNGERYLAASIESILDQTFDDFELIIINDGSQDRSREVATAFRDPRILVLDNPTNLGLPRSLNQALAQCAGDYIARQDADDVSDRRRLARQVEYLDGLPPVGLVGTWYIEIDAEGRSNGKRTVPCDHLQLSWALLFYSPFVHGSVMIRREVVEAVGAYSEAFPTSQDYELWLRIARRFQVANLPEYLLRLRTHDRSMTTVEGNRASRGHRLRLDNIVRRLEWDTQDPAALDHRFAALSALATGFVPRTLDLGDPTGAAGDLLRLLEVFCADSRLSVDDAARLRRQVSAHAAQALLVLATRQLAQGDGDAGRLVRLAYQTGGVATLSPRIWKRALRDSWGTLLKRRRRTHSRAGQGEDETRGYS